MPDRKFYVRRPAEVELAAAISWYDGKRAGLGREFLAEVDRAFAKIHRAPERWPLWRVDRPFRSLRLRRFPFVVFYRVTSGYVRVSAVAHTSRRPGYWQER